MAARLRKLKLYAGTIKTEIVVLLAIVHGTMTSQQRSERPLQGLGPTVEEKKQVGQEHWELEDGISQTGPGFQKRVCGIVGSSLFDTYDSEEPIFAWWDLLLG